MRKKTGLIESTTTGRIYNVEDGCRIIDLKQQQLYLAHNLTLLDVYHSKKDGQIIVVMVFDKKESYPYFLKWKNRTLTDPNVKAESEGEHNSEK